MRSLEWWVRGRSFHHQEAAEGPHIGIPIAERYAVLGLYSVGFIDFGVGTT